VTPTDAAPTRRFASPQVRRVVDHVEMRDCR
jgi:hypothetical protein